MLRTTSTRNPHRRAAAPVLAVALVMSTACADTPAPAPTGDSHATTGPAPNVFAPELQIDLDSMTQTEGGVWVQDVTIGRGAPAEPGRTVVLEYKAWLPDGTLYEQRPSAEGFGAPELVLGEVQPRGLNEAIDGMRAGGVRRIVIPPALGYGLVGRPAGVPAGATLVFEIRLRSVSGPA